MIFGKTKLELKVGIFVFVGIIILSIFVLSVGKFKTLTSGYKIKVTFNFANGVKLGAPVRFSGIDVGEVKHINFNFIPQDSRTEVELICWLRKSIKVPRDSTVWVNTLGLLGEKYIEIMPGKDYQNVLSANEVIAGVDPIPMHEVTRLAKDIADNIDRTFVQINSKEGTIGKFIYDSTIYDRLEAMVTDISNNPWKLFWRTKER